MRRLRNFVRILLFSSILLWTLGFLLGKGISVTWSLAGLAVFVAPLSGVILVTMLLTGLGATQEEKRRKAGEILNCVKCGRPSIPGSQYCRYHHDIMTEDKSPGAR